MFWLYEYTLLYQLKVLATAVFMAKVGSIKQTPKTVEEMFFPEAANLGGDTLKPWDSAYNPTLTLPAGLSPEPFVSRAEDLARSGSGQGSGASMETIMAVYPRHKTVVDAFKERGDVIGIGPFADRGNMAIFRSREAAEAFVKEDPFILEGLIQSYVIRDWHDTMLE